MKICRNCGTANVSSGQNCFKCFASLANAEENAKTTTCGNCSAVNAVGAHFCYNCGQSLKPVTHFCNSCGAVNRPEDVYCLDCGRKILLDNVPPQSAPVVVVAPQPAVVAAPVIQAAPQPVAAPVVQQPMPQPVSQPVAPVVQPAPVYTHAIRETESPKYQNVSPPSISPPANPPQTKHQYRIQLFLMFAALGGILYLLTQTFFTAGVLEISGLGALLIIPFIFIPDTVSNLLPSIKFLDDAKLAAGAVANMLEKNFAGIFAYILFGIITITVIALLLGLIVALFRLIFNKPYNRTRKGLLYLCLTTAVLAGLELLAVHVPFVEGIFLGNGTTFGVFEPQMFFYIFVGGLLALFILSRIARVKTPKVSKRRQRKNEKKLAKKVEKKASKAQKKAA